jgi:hypothetical protein
VVEHVHPVTVAVQYDREVRTMRSDTPPRCGHRWVRHYAAEIGVRYARHASNAPTDVLAQSGHGFAGNSAKAVHCDCEWSVGPFGQA